jgi:hypothetical protein
VLRAKGCGRNQGGVKKLFFHGQTPIIIFAQAQLISPLPLL